MSDVICILPVDPNDEKVQAIIEELSAHLLLRFGSDGKNSFTGWQADNPDFVFVIAKINTEIVGCGAIRPIDKNTGEVKRMYSKLPRKKIGQTILAALEEKAKIIGYTNLILETRVNNKEAVLFYHKQGYSQIPNYGKYIGRMEAVCFGKSLT